MPVLARLPIAKTDQARPAGGGIAALERRVELAAVAWSIERALAAKVALGAALLAAGVGWALHSPSPATWAAAVGAGVVGYLVPDVVLSRLASRRQLAIANELPDVLDQLTVCVEAGLGFDAALARASKSRRGHLAGEMARTLQDLRMGVPRQEALDGLLGRTDVPELRQFVHAVSQAETYGVPIARALRAQAVEQREKRRFRAEERAMKLPVKVVFPLVFCILPCMFVVIIGPAALRLIHGL